MERWSAAGALAVVAAWPAAGSTLAVLQLLLGPADAACSCRRLLGILDPADELVAGQRCDAPPGIQCRGVGDQRLPEVCWKFVHHPTGHSRGAHRATVAAVRGACPRSANRGAATIGGADATRRSTPRDGFGDPRHVGAYRTTPERRLVGVTERQNGTSACASAIRTGNRCACLIGRHQVDERSYIRQPCGCPSSSTTRRSAFADGKRFEASAPEFPEP
jgi:hypothetical protein